MGSSGSNVPLVDMRRPVRPNVGATVASIRADHLRAECADHNVVGQVIRVGTPVHLWLGAGVDGFALEISARHRSNRALRTTVLIGVAETLFAWVFGLALGAVFTAILLINALAF